MARQQIQGGAGAGLAGKRGLNPLPLDSMLGEMKEAIASKKRTAAEVAAGSKPPQACAKAKGKAKAKGGKPKAKAQSKPPQDSAKAKRQGTHGLLLGCSKCRGSHAGCLQCMSPAFNGRRWQR